MRKAGTSTRCRGRSLSYEKVLELMAQDQLVQQPVADRGLERARADVLEVLPQRRPGQELEVATDRARGLERVVELCEIRAQQRPAG